VLAAAYFYSEKLGGTARENKFILVPVWGEVFNLILGLLIVRRKYV
jgi:hypothetical protein